jgi:hypothetical protein
VLLKPAEVCQTRIALGYYYLCPAPQMIVAGHTTPSKRLLSWSWLYFRLFENKPLVGLGVGAQRLDEVFGVDISAAGAGQPVS